MTTCDAEASQRSTRAMRGRLHAPCLSGKVGQSALMKVCNAEARQEKMTSDQRKAYLATASEKSA